MQRKAFEGIRGRIERKYEERLAQLDVIEENAELLEKLTDASLNVHEKNPYFQYHGFDAVWPLTNFVDCPEMAADPAFRKMYDLYTKVYKIDTCVLYTDQIHPLRPVIDSLDRLATKMANRTLTEPEYNAIMKEEGEAFDAFYSLFRRPASVPVPGYA